MATKDAFFHALPVPVNVVRYATRETDYWELRSAEASHREHPTTFWIPPLEQRRSLHRGHAAKLIFEIESEAEDGKIEVQGERIWVIVAERVGEQHIGILDGQPACVVPSPDVYLGFGAEIPFGPEHAIDIGNPPPEYVAWQLGQAPERCWPRT